ncbi:hypothetical protein FGG08_004255 [Glutinoglossum americanum]|uniref:Prion-inhibition and propagation HeLo domain-containing protein n=1 Tax=Glutinoglossum americanum TaxID=1670608 RepID=A0A9P8KZR1_9PEZI|nr:hypothetical protein FGG08_004255 [Glutinoglossum americanum]
MDVVSTVAAALEFLKAARACLYFYHEARQNIPQIQRELRLRLEVEAITFERWCSAVGIRGMLDAVAEDPSGWGDGHKFKEFKKSLQDDLRFDSEPIANLVVEVLRGLGEKFEDARSRFQSSRPSTASIDLLVGAKGPTSKWRGPFRSLGRKNRGTQVKILDIDIEKSLTNFCGAVKWFAWNKRIFLQLLDDLTKTNECLLKLLGAEIQDQIKRRVQIQVLGNSGSENLSIAEGLPATSKDKQEIGALAGVKQMKIRENEVDNGEADGNPGYNSDTKGKITQPNPRLTVFQVDDFRGTMQPGPSRTRSILGGRQVLVEWKHYNPSRPLRFEQIMRLGALVGMLNKHDVYQRFHIPHCKGLVQDEQNSQIGIVFDIPAPKGSGEIEHSNLQDLIRKSRAEPPPIGQRFRIAKDLSVALHYLQSVHWLHKSFRSDNVVYFVPSKPKGDKVETTEYPNEAGDREDSSDTANRQDAVVESENQSTRQETLSHGKEPLRTAPPPLSPFYVIGLDLSRPDHPSELTETLSISTSGYHSKILNTELYSHPSSQLKTPSGKHVRFRAEFDIYSLGLVLLEVGLWRTLDSMRRQAAREKADFREKLRTGYCDELLVAVGVVYWRAVQRCLNGDFDLSDRPEGVEEGVALQLAFERQVVCELEKCVA